MDLKLSFHFRNKNFSCLAFIDNSDYPCYVFVELLDPNLSSEFGEELTLKTDFDHLLPKKDDYPGLILLQEAILNSIKKMPAYEKSKQQCNQNKNSINKRL